MNNNGENGISKKKENTAKRIIIALKETQGLLTLAARKAGVSYRTVNRYANELPSVREAVEEAKEAVTDLAEGKLYGKISDGDVTSIIFYLKTQGKKRGYIEKQEIEHSGHISEASDLPDEELERIIHNRRSKGVAEEAESS